MRHQFESEHWLPYPRSLVFAFFANPRNLPPLMPRWQRARIDEATYISPPPRPQGTPDYGTLAAGDGTRLRITARGFPFLPLRAPWDALIEDFRWDEGFCDVQLRGPFRYWRHCHSVRDANSPATGEAGTIVRDHVTYELPLPPFGGVALPFARLALRSLFRYRQQQATVLVGKFADSVTPSASLVLP